MCFLSCIRYQVFLLHSSVQTLDQKKVLEAPPSGIRKIASSRELCQMLRWTMSDATLPLLLQLLSFWFWFFFIADTFYQYCRNKHNGQWCCVCHWLRQGERGMTLNFPREILKHSCINFGDFFFFKLFSRLRSSAYQATDLTEKFQHPFVLRQIL